MEESKVINLTKAELYERDWSVPISKLCKEFGLSDRALIVRKEHAQLLHDGNDF